MLFSSSKRFPDLPCWGRGPLHWLTSPAAKEYTGSSRISQEVLVANAEHLTLVILELGEKCLVVPDSFSSSWDKEDKHA
ncbi:hypothetical protein MLD38_017156 [Melastoma candidum]|uniref:Uncharacterized protein n=1 Tax=Melastoma candidum TaxID=119954 RepID=A0ACB9QSU2_9MYRT|nr:hypothetical protein MLD38_017156 [Melastoma candidum]